MLSKFYYALQICRSFLAGGFVYLVFLLFPAAVMAQAGSKQAEMAKDERGKYIYYELIEKSVIPADSLKFRALRFLKARKLIPVKQENGGLLASGKMVLNKSAFVLTHPSGEVCYNFIFEMKAGKYRFWLTDFVFTPYKRDRYGNFVPAAVKGVPLENSPGKLNAAEWASYTEAVNRHAALFANDLKNYLSAAGQKKVKDIIQQKNW